MSSFVSALAPWLLALTAACSVFTETDQLGDGEHESFSAGGKADGIELTPLEVDGVLRVVNTATLTQLDDDAALDRRAARNIVSHRAGTDGLDGTADDDRFDDLAELDAVPYVGPSALAHLLAYAYERGYVAPPADGEPCLIISEYVEGSGNYNKAIELYNCGTDSLELARYGICLVRNDDDTCSVTAPLADMALDAGAVVTVCRTKTGTFLDPLEPLREACDLERPGVMTFNGDDRVVLFEDADGDLSFGPADTVADALGRFGWRPHDLPWAEVTLRRCNLQPSDGYAYYDHLDYFVEYPRTALSDFGVPPIAGCP